jgi:hypothetical protein
MKDNPNPANDFMKQHGAPDYAVDENLMFEYQDGKVKVLWASVYGKDFVKCPKGFLTNQPTYRNFCGEVALKVPAKRLGPDFDAYINKALAQATLRETSPGMEEGAVVRNAILTALWKYRSEWRNGRDNVERFCDYDVDISERKKRSVEKGDPAFIETVRDGPGYPELFVRINAFMDHMTILQSQGYFERKITREDVIDELKKMGREPYAPTGVSPRRLRSTYPIPWSMYMEWREEDPAADEREEMGYQNK